MRKFAYILFFSVFALSCNKGNNYNPEKEKDEPVPNSDDSMLGEWKYTENYVSPGIAWHWEKVENGLTLTINENATYKITDGTGIANWPFSEIGIEGKLGTAKNSWGATVTYFVKQGTTDSLFFNPIRVKKDTLELAGPCVEGCTYRFRKTK